MTEDTTRPTGAANRAMKNVDHTHPDTDRPFGEAVVFARGPAVAADGGERKESERTDGARTSGEENENTEAEDDGTEQMKDVDHEPPNDAEANRVFERGREGRDDDR